MQRALVLLVPLLGCVGPAPWSEPKTAPQQTRVDLPPEPILYGLTQELRPLHYLELGDGTLTLLLLATIHGNESAGTPLLEQLERELKDRPALLEGRRVLLVAVANPDGLERKQRTNARGVDLNRNFGSKNFRSKRRHGPEPLSEPESKALGQLVMAQRPARVLTIHQPLGCIDWDGPASELSQEMASLCGLPARQIGSRPGSLGSWVGVDLGTPIVTLELPRAADSETPDELWELYGDALLRFVAWQSKSPSSR